jgi:hypothetical protein
VTDDGPGFCLPGPNPLTWVQWVDRVVSPEMVVGGLADGAVGDAGG